MKLAMIALAIVLVVMVGLLIYTHSYSAAVEARYPLVGQTVDVNGTLLHYVDRAPHPDSGTDTSSSVPVVLVHGMSANLRDMLSALGQPLVDKGLRVLAFDRPGRGYSGRGPDNAYDPAIQADLIRGALDALGVEQAIMVGHSWGGAVVTAFAVRHPAKTAGVVDLAGATHAWGGGASWYNQIAVFPLVGSVFTHTLVSVVGPLLLPSSVEGAFTPDPAPDGYAEEVGISLLFRPASFRNNALDHYHLNDVLAEQSQTYVHIKAPLTIMSGDADPVVSFSIHSTALHAQVPHSKLIRFEGAGHMIHHVHTAPIVDEIIALARPTKLDTTE